MLVLGRWVEVKTGEEIVADLIHTGGGLGEDGMKIEDIPDYPTNLMSGGILRAKAI